MDERTAAAVHAAESRAAVFRWLSIAFGVALMAGLWRTHAALSGTLGGSVDLLYAHIARIGGGDFSTAIPLEPGHENSVLGWLSETQAKLSVTDRERKKAENEVLQLNAALEQRVVERTAELEASNRELRAFSYSVAHDLRAPLRGMGGFAKVLMDDYADKLDADGLDCLHEIQSNAAKMAQLIDALLSLSKLARTELRPERVDLTELGHLVAGQLAAAEPERHVDVVIQEGLHAEVDPQLARVLLENLLGNAWKFTKNAAEARIELGVTEEAGTAAFFVRDNGAGFDMGHAGKLFGPFQRLHTAHEFPGTGIGLATVQRIVNRHRGRIWAEAAVGAGATFHFTLKTASEGATT